MNRIKHYLQSFRQQASPERSALDQELDEMLEALTPTGLYLYIMIDDLAEIAALHRTLDM